MKHCWLTVLLLVCFTPSAQAQSTPTVGVYFDTDGAQRSLAVEPWKPFTAWVLAENVNEGIQGFELGVDFPDGLTILGATVAHPCVALDCGWGQGPTDWAVGLGECSASESALALLHLELMITDDSNLQSDQICVISPGQGSLDPAVPAYLTCASAVAELERTAPTDESPAGCAQLLLAGVDNWMNSWSTLKAVHAVRR